MPFGLCNAPATFHAATDGPSSSRVTMVSLPCLLGQCNHTGDSFTSHLDYLRTVFDRLRAAGLKLKPPKFNFFQQKVQYLGHVVWSDP